MPINSRWVKLEADSRATLNREIARTAFVFIESRHGKYSPEIANRLLRKPVLARWRKLLREIVATNAASVEHVERDTSSERERFGATADKFRLIQEILDSIPEDHLLGMEEYNSYYHDLLLSSDLYNILSAYSAHFRKQSWKTRGRPSDLIMKNTVSACVRSLEYITDAPFKRNFHSEQAAGDMIFTNPDCAYCETILKIIAPALTHKEIKAGLKMHFSLPRSQPVSHVGPSKRPIYGDPQKQKKSS